MRRGEASRGFVRFGLRVVWGYLALILVEVECGVKLRLLCQEFLEALLVLEGRSSCSRY